jgi:hypothetical protein
MKPIRFMEANKDLLKPEGMSDLDCGSLPVFTDGRYCISCWKPNLKERLSIFIFGKVWLWVMSGVTQPPVAIEGKKTV